MAQHFLPIQQIQPLGDMAAIFTKGAANTQEIGEGELSFTAFLSKELAKLNDGVNAPSNLTGDLATGNLDSLHKISVENAKADVLLKLATKVMSSLAMDFKTLMQMQI